MQALPFGKLLLARLGADVMQIEHPLIGAAGVAAGPVFSAPQVIDDSHLQERDMIVEIGRTSGLVGRARSVIR
jgi:hypothetical protein